MQYAAQLWMHALFGWRKKRKCSVFYMYCMHHLVICRGWVGLVDNQPSNGVMAVIKGHPEETTAK